MTIAEIGSRARAASRTLRRLSTDRKNAALRAMADALRADRDAILAANADDLRAAEGAGLSGPMLRRLSLTDAAIASMAAMIEEVAALPDPIGEVEHMSRRPNGLRIGRMRVPLGVVAIIYESRPNVTTDCAALCLKSGNAAILRGGKEAIATNRAVAASMARALRDSGLPDGAVALIEDTSRESALELMRAREYVDVLIPRGGASLIRAVVETSNIPTIETGTGNCHIYVDASADIARALAIVRNAKTTAPSVCNALEKTLVHASIAPDFLGKLPAAIPEVELRGDARACALVPGMTFVADDAPEWDEEYLDLILGVRVVDSLDEALSYIDAHSTHHSEAILTESYANAQRFLGEVDSAAVYVNASTRFTDGNEFGLGAEIGISTQKLHARGPMGLRELTTTKYVVYGEGQVRG